MINDESYYKKGRSASNKNSISGKYLIEGKYYSIREIAEILGINRNSVTKKICGLKSINGPVTWEKLEWQ